MRKWNTQVVIVISFLLHTCFSEAFTISGSVNTKASSTFVKLESTDTDASLENHVDENTIKPRKRKSVPSTSGKNITTYASKQKPNSIDQIYPLTDLKLGSTVDGWVAAFTDFGVFIKIPFDLKKKGGQAGYALLHKSQISEEEITPSKLKKMFRIGQVLKNLRVITINYAKGEVGLSTRQQRQKRKNLSNFSVGKEYTGKVVNVMAYGAFVDIGANSNALLHISRISPKKIENIRHFVNEGDVVQVRIIAKDEKKQKMAASMLDSDADLYLDRRSAQLNRMKNRVQRTMSDDIADAMKANLKAELEYFEDAVKELESTLNES